MPNQENNNVKTWASGPSLAIMRCVTLGKSVHLSESVSSSLHWIRQFSGGFQIQKLTYTSIKLWIIHHFKFQSTPSLCLPALYKAPMQVFSPNAQHCEVSVCFPTWLMQLRTQKSQVTCSESHSDYVAEHGFLPRSSLPWQVYPSPDSHKPSLCVSQRPIEMVYGLLSSLLLCCHHLE